MKYTLSVLVENHAGVLSKVSGLFSRRGFNIDSLAVGITEDSNFSRITIVADGDEYVIEQLEKQLNKVIPVIKVRTFAKDEFISRELALIKVNCPAKQRLDIGYHEDLRADGCKDRRCITEHHDAAVCRHAGTV